MFLPSLQPQMLELNMKFCAIAMHWLLEFHKEHNKTDRPLVETVFASLPEYVIKDIVHFVNFLSRYKPKQLVHMNLSLVMRFAVAMMNEPFLIRSPIIRAQLASFITDMNQHSKP